MFTEEAIREISAHATRLGVEPASLLAVAEVESAGKSFAFVDGRQEPLIRFEGHYFDRRLPPELRAKARAAGLASPTPGKVRNPISQAARWRLLERASQIDRKAAYESVSWGIGQVMGAHWRWLGYPSVEELAEEARSGLDGQIRLMTAFIQKAGLAEPLRTRDWAAFARGYNGPLYKRHGYDTKLQRAYAAYRRGGAEAGWTALRHGACGDAVRELQLALTALGYALQADGVYGPQSAAAVRRFQEDRGLAVDGVVGEHTWAAIEALLRSRSASGPWSLLKAALTWLFGYWRTGRARHW